MNLSTSISHLKFKSCICNASGPKCSLLEELQNLDNSVSCAVITKTSTLEKREGNPQPRYYDNLLGSINSMGLPNQGHNYYIKHSEKINKPYIISMTGFSLDELITVLTNIIISKTNFNKKIDGIEINLSCPNIIGKGQIAYDFKELDNYLKEICFIYSNLLERFNEKPILGIKLPPYFEIHHFETAGEIISKYPIDFITCINSIGNALLVDIKNESTVIKPKGGIGGLGGSYVKPTGLSNVRNFYLQFKKRNRDIKIIGCGGIETGKDAFEYILCGADLLQIGTQFYKEDVGCFNRILKELTEVMKYKKYNNIDEFKGKLKTI